MEVEPMEVDQDREHHMEEVGSDVDQDDEHSMEEVGSDVDKDDEQHMEELELEEIDQKIVREVIRESVNTARGEAKDEVMNLPPARAIRFFLKP